MNTINFMKMVGGASVAAIILYVFNDILLELFQLFVMIVVVPVMFVVALFGFGDGALQSVRWFTTTGLPRFREDLASYQKALAPEPAVTEPPPPPPKSDEPPRSSRIILP